MEVHGREKLFPADKINEGFMKDEAVFRGADRNLGKGKRGVQVREKNMMEVLGKEVGNQERRTAGRTMWL